MEKKPMTMEQKFKIFRLSRIVSYGLLIFAILMYDLGHPLTWFSIALVIGVSVFRVLALRCPECDALIPSNFGIVAKRCDKCNWQLGKEKDASQAEDTEA